MYNLKRYLTNIDIIKKIINIIENENLSINELIDVVNTLADFIQYNNFYITINSFNYLSDFLVNTIEKFEEADNENIRKELILILNQLIVDIDKDTKVNLYFAGKDKYNLVEKALKIDIEKINISEFLLKDNKKNDLQIDILIMSEETIDIDSNALVMFNDVIYYDKVMNDIFTISENIYYGNYDYNYLVKSIDSAKSSEVEAIVVGNSYPLTGIDATLLDLKTVSLALSSQDLYYAFQLAKLAINNNDNIKKCIIGVGYYLVNHDLSKSQNMDAVNRVKNVYYPILKDMHNSTYVEESPIICLNSILKDEVMKFLFDLDFLDVHFKDMIYRSNKGYFNLNFTREMNSMLRGTKLKDICEEEKWKLGEFRANQHNKLSKYNDTTKEYNNILNEFITFLDDRKVEAIIIVFPSTKYYKKFLNNNYEDKFYEIINGINENKKIKLIDFSKEDIFGEDDFIDFDHMSEVGAMKITSKINQII